MADRKSAIYTLGQGLVSTAFRLVNPVTRKDLDKLPRNGPVLVCCNHLSNKDPIVLGGVLPRQLYFMAKEELFHNALVGGVLRGLGAFPVHRGKGDEKAMDTARELLREGKVVAIFIEGTRSRDGKLQQPKSGAAVLAHQMQVPILPMCITCRGQQLPKAGQRLIVSCGDPILPAELGIEHEDNSDYRRAARLIMSRIRALRERDLKEFDHESTEK